MKITRHQDWPLRFEAFCAARRAIPFVWGANDCSTFAADCVCALTGTDPAPPSLRLHKTAKQALRAIKRHGGLCSIATAALGQPVPSSRANIGDVVLTKIGGREALAVCNGATALGPGPQGLQAVPMQFNQLAWRIG